MRWRIKWVNTKTGTTGYGEYSYDSKERADKIADRLNQKRGKTHSYTAVKDVA
jgi:hypothetical protein